MSTPKSKKKLTPAQEASDPSTSPERLAELAAQDIKLSRAVAKNSTTPPDILKTLGESGDEATRKSIAGNPNSPTDTLTRLATQFPEEVIQNPVFDLLLLENPNLLSEIPLASLRSLLKRQSIPIAFLSWAAKHEDVGVQLAVALNPLTPAKAVKGLVMSPYPNVRAAAEQHINYAEADDDFDWQRAFWEGIGTDDLVQKKENIEPLLTRDLIDPRVFPELSKEFRLELASGKNTNLGVLKRFCQDPSEDVRSALLENPSLTPEILQALEADPSQTIREQVANHDQTYRHPDSENEFIRAHIARITTDQSVLERLSADWHWRVREAAAENPALNLRVDSVNEYARRKLAHHPTLSESQIRSLAVDPDMGVQKAIAQHPSLPSDLAVEFAKRADKDLRLAAAQHPSLPIEWCQRLAFDEDWQIRQAVIYRDSLQPSLIRQMAYDPDSDVRRAVAMNPQLPLRELQMLDKDDQSSVRAAALFNPSRPFNEKILHDLLRKDTSSIVSGITDGLKYRQNIPVSLIRQLATNSDWRIRQGIASLPTTPVDVLQILLNDTDSDVQQAVLSNPSCPGGVVKGIPIGRASDPETSSDELLELSKSKDWRVRQAVAANPKAPLEALKKLSLDTDHDIQIAVAENPKTDAESLAKLVNTRHSYWRCRLKVAERADVPADLCWRLALDGVPGVRAAIADNPTVPPHTRHLASLELSALFELNLLDEQWDYLIQGIHSQHLRQTLNTSNLPDACLEKILIHHDWEVRLQLARFTTRPDLVFVLLQDDDSDVRTAASQNPHLKNLTIDHVRSRWQLYPEQRTAGRFKKQPEDAQAYLQETRPSLLQELLPYTSDCPWVWLRRLLAAHPELPEKQLQQLVGDGDSKVREQVANSRRIQADPNSTNEFLRAQAAATADLSWEQMNTLAEDPSSIVRLSLLANPGLGDILRTQLTAEISEKPTKQTWQKILSLPVCPEILLDQGIQHKDWEVRQWAASSPSLLISHCERLSHDSDSDVIKALVENPHLSPHCLSHLSHSDSWRVRKVSGNPLLPAADLVRLLCDADGDVQEAALRNPSLTDEMLWEALSGAGTGEIAALVRHGVIRGMEFPAEQLQQYVESSNYEIRRAIAPSAQLTSTQLEALTQDKRYEVSRAALQNPLVSEELLRYHLQHRHWRSVVVSQLLQRDAFTPEELLAWAIDDDVDIRKAVAAHGATPPHILLDLARDGEESVRGAVAGHPTLTEKIWRTLAEDRSESIQKQMSVHPLRYRNAKIKNTFLRMEIVTDPAATDLELIATATDKDPAIRTRVAAHPNTPADVLAKLSLDNDEAVGFAARSNPNFQPELEVPILLLKLTASNKPSFSRFLALLRPEVPVSSLAKNFRSSSWLERCAIAMNSMTPDSTLQALLEDGNRVVRSAALDNWTRRHPQ